MATGTQVPWTTPGGTPCCCIEPCFTDLANQPKGAFSANSYSDISANDYASIYAGGTYLANYAINVTGSRDAFSFSLSNFGVNTATETHSANGQVLLSPTTSVDAPCYQAYAASISVVRSFTNPNIASDSYSTTLRFVRSLGTSNGAKISLATVEAPSSANVITEAISLNPLTNNIPQVILRAGSMSAVPYTCTGDSVYFPPLGIARSIQLVVGGNTYSAIGAVAHGCFASVGHFNQVINGEQVACGAGQCSASVSGSISLQVTFTPSAP